MEKGEIKKMILKAYEDNKFTKELKGVSPYELMINPESIKISRSIQYDETSNQKKTAKYKGKSAATYSFDFIIDGTGVLNMTCVDVNMNIAHLKQVIYNHVPEKHRSPFVEIDFCNEIFRCVLSSFNLSYDLFRPDGSPLRVKVSCSFTEVINIVKDAKKKDNKSPDLTHRLTVMTGDSLVDMSRKVYDKNDYYIDVAKANRLNNFRCLKIGQDIYFPPLKDKEQ